MIKKNMTEQEKIQEDVLRGKDLHSELESNTLVQAWEDFVEATGYNDFIWRLMERLKKVLAILIKFADNIQN